MNYTENQKEIYKICMEYPFLIPRDVDGKRDEEFDYTYLPLEIPDGWNRLFYQMCSDINPILEREGLLDKFYFIQVKEKFNNLICYTNGVEPAEVKDIIDKYEHTAYYICTVCGKPATCVSTGYWASFCDDCTDHFEHEHTIPIEFKSEFEKHVFNKGEKTEKIISFENEWNGYLECLQ